MKKRFIALFMIFTILLVFALPKPSEAAWPWWDRNKHIVKADAIGALTGIGGGWMGAVIGGALGSLTAGISAGGGSGGWEPPKDIIESVGLHHNLALDYVIGDQKIGELDEKEIKEKLLSYANQYKPSENDMKIIRMLVSGEKMEKVNTSYEFERNLDIAMKMLDENGNPNELVRKAVSFLREKAKNIPFDQINAEIEKRKSTGMNMDDIGYLVVADVLEHSFDFWGGNKSENMKNEFKPIDVKPENLSELWDIVLADVYGYMIGYNIMGNTGGGVYQAMLSSMDAAMKMDAGQGSWEKADVVTSGYLHNRGLMIAQGAEDREKAMVRFFKDNDIDISNEEIVAINGCTPTWKCMDNPLMDWIEAQNKANKMNVSDGFSGKLNEVMAVAFNDKDFDADKTTEALKELLIESAKASGTQPTILRADEYKMLEEKLKKEGKPQDIIYASIFVDMYLHSTGYWLGDEGPVKSINYIIDLRKLLEPKDQRPPEPKIEISLNIGSDKAKINNVDTMMDVMPVVRNQRTLVPFRFIGEALNAKINWIQENKEATYELGDMKLSLFIDETRILVNGEERQMDVKPLVINQRILVPIRVISETLGFEVEWIQERQEVRVISK